VGVPLTWKDEDENTPLHHAARGGQLEVVEYLLENNLSPHDKNNHNFTALHEAASGNHLATMKYLVAKGANINEKDGEGFTVLCLAVDQGFFDMVQWLHRNGAFINSSALYLAARYEQLQIVAYLIENTSQEVMQEALYVAIAKDDFIAVKCLVAHDVSIHGKYQGKPLLHCAAYRGDFEIVECLVERGVSPEEKDDENFTALHAAVLGATTEGDPLKIMKYLVAKGTPLDEKSIQGDTALDIAITQGFLEIVLFLLSNGAYIENAILFKAVSAGDSYLNIALSLVSHGASIYEKLEGETLLHCAASLGHFEMAKWLVESGLSLHEKDGKGHTALFQAVQQGYLDVARLLMNIEENSNEKEDADQTAVVLTKTEENALTNLHGPGETKAMTESFADNQNPAPVLRNSALLKLHGAFAYATPRSDTFSFDAMKALLEQEFKEVNSISHIEENAEIQIIFNDKVFCREATEYLYRQFGGPANLDSYEEGMWRLLGEDNDSIAINYTCAQRIVESFSVSSDNKFV
jgi:ankyrin repeat protein